MPGASTPSWTTRMVVTNVVDRFESLCRTLQAKDYEFERRDAIAGASFVVVTNDRLSNDTLRAIARLGYVIRHSVDGEFVISRPIVE